MKTEKGFTLVELMVVIGIIGVLMAVLVKTFGGSTEKAEIAKCQELVKNVETSLSVLFDTDGSWPQCLIDKNNGASGLDEAAAYPLATRGGMSLTYDSGAKRLKNHDRFGIVTTWAAAVVKDRGSACSLGTKVPVGGTVADHRLFYALDLDGDGKIENVSPGMTVPDLPKSEAKSVSIRATAAVWCRGPKGKLIKSWTDAQTENVN